MPETVSLRGNAFTLFSVYDEEDRITASWSGVVDHDDNVRLTEYEYSVEDNLSCRFGREGVPGAYNHYRKVCHDDDARLVIVDNDANGDGEFDIEVTHRFDEMGTHIEAVSIQDEMETAYRRAVPTYDGSGRLVSMERWLGRDSTEPESVATYEYDEIGWPSTIETIRADVEFERIDLTYSHEGRIVDYRRTDGPWIGEPFSYTFAEEVRSIVVNNRVHVWILIRYAPGRSDPYSAFVVRHYYDCTCDDSSMEEVAGRVVTGDPGQFDSLIELLDAAPEDLDLSTSGCTCSW